MSYNQLLTDSLVGESDWVDDNSSCILMALNIIRKLPSRYSI